MKVCHLLCGAGLIPPIESNFSIQMVEGKFRKNVRISFLPIENKLCTEFPQNDWFSEIMEVVRVKNLGSFNARMREVYIQMRFLSMLVFALPIYIYALFLLEGKAAETSKFNFRSLNDQLIDGMLFGNYGKLKEYVSILSLEPLNGNEKNIFIILNISLLI